jgi:uncharacterized phage protein (TIGR01671 family)
MREIKFRAWDITEKIMHTWEQWCKEEKQENFIVLNNDYYILMQYTGLKDKNGKEIYEGDIVFRDILGEDEIYVVEYNPIDAGYNPFCVAGEYNDEWILTKHSRVIGNIYENPELLESEK